MTTLLDSVDAPNITLWQYARRVDQCPFNRWPNTDEAMSIKVKRVYDEAEDGDGLRILVDRIWPRGLSREKARIDQWIKEIAPTSELRKWYGHDPEKWNEFKNRYFQELQENAALVDELRHKGKTETITFLFSSKEPKLNNAYALKEFIESGGK